MGTVRLEWDRGRRSARVLHGDEEIGWLDLMIIGGEEGDDAIWVEPSDSTRGRGRWFGCGQQDDAVAWLVARAAREE